MDEPPVHEPEQVDPALGIGLQALHEVAHEAEAPAAAVLAAERRHLAAVLVEHEEARLVDERVAGPDHAVEHIQVAAARHPRAGVQRFVETAERGEHARAEAHVRAGAEVPGAAGIQPIIDGDRAVADAIEAAPEPAAAFEDDLRLRLELQRQDLAGERAGIQIRGPRLAQPRQPPTIHDDVVVQVGQELARCLADGAVAAEIQPGLRLEDVAHVRPACREVARAAVRGRVVDDEHFDRPAGGSRLGQLRAQRFKEALDPRGPIPGADRHRQRGERERITARRQLFAHRLGNDSLAEVGRDALLERVNRNTRRAVCRLHPVANRHALPAHEHRHTGVAGRERQFLKRMRDVDVEAAVAHQDSSATVAAGDRCWSRYIRANRPPSATSSRSVPRSRTRPFSSTMI